MSSMYPSFGGAPARPCMRCGTPLTINETQCSRCGLVNPPPQGQQFGAFQPGAQGMGPGPSGPLWGGQPAPPYQQGGNGGVGFGNQDASSSAWGPGPGGQAGGWNQNNSFGGQDDPLPPHPVQNNLFGSSLSSPPPFQPPARPPAFDNAFGGPGLQQNGQRPSLNSFMQATQSKNGFGGASSPAANRPNWASRPGGNDNDDYKKQDKNRPSAGVVIVIIILLVVLIGGGGYGGYYLYKHRNDGAATTPTANTPRIVTPTGKPLFSDAFKNNINKWSTNAPTGAKVTLKGDGQLILESNNNKLFPEPVPGGKIFGDLEIDIDAGLSGGDPNNGYGVYIRASSTQNSALGLYYRFELYGDGSFYIYKGALDANGTSQATALKNSLQPNNAITHVGTINHLTIIAKGQSLSLSVNGTVVASFTDPSYKSGSVALFVSQVKGATTSAQAIFKNLTIFSAP